MTKRKEREALYDREGDVIGRLRVWDEESDRGCGARGCAEDWPAMDCVSCVACAERLERCASHSSGVRGVAVPVD